MEEHKQTIYISGPMSGYENHNIPAFDAAEADLKARGYNVISPANNDNRSTDKSWVFYMKEDVKHVTNSDIVVVLDGWEKSKGAQVETYLARILEIPILKYPSLEPIEEKNVLEEALGLVTGDRNKAYGHPYNDYLTSSIMFNSWMSHKYPNGWDHLEPDDAAMFMVFVKLSREAHSHKKDSIVDAAGYLLCYDMILKKVKEENAT